ncbi:MAG: transketolase [Actinobacteria bacterium]|nr:transketolase [Actinomycetota bacterium]
MSTHELNKTELNEIAKAIRGLSIDAIEAAGCGHPGLPLGCAEIGAYLYAKYLNYNPKQTDWSNRDRFILSAGHGSMLLYSCLYLAGYDVSLDDIKQFRQLNAPTAGHPEYGELPGVETTTGPLGQGLANGVGMALGNRMVQSQLNLKELMNGRVVVLTGDGCMMEGVTGEASSLAGHLGLGNLTVIYDSNDICLDGPTEECFTEDVAQRYESYGWDVQQIDGHNFNEIQAALAHADTQNKKPSLIIAKTTIGFGAPSVAGTSEVHGKALGESEAEKTKEALGIPVTPLFHVSNDVKSYFETHQQQLKAKYDSWETQFKQWQEQNPELAKKWSQYNLQTLPNNFEEHLSNVEIKDNIATRQASSAVLQYLYESIPNLVGGSADLSCSDNTMMKKDGIVSADNYSERNIKYGVREFAMAAIANGLVLQGQLRTYIGTFFTFSDYMKNAIRLAAIMRVPVIYQFTHDSVLLGEDGPTHQPVEHLASLRATPGITVIRPADGNETKGAWSVALRSKEPVAIVLSRQKCPKVVGTQQGEIKNGAYIIKDSENTELDFCLLATGSELSLAIEVADQLSQKGITSVRVVSVPSFELFNEQTREYRNKILGNARQYCSIEAQSSFGWHQYIGRDGITISMDRFGASAPESDLREKFGFTANAITKKLLTVHEVTLQQ